MAQYAVGMTWGVLVPYARAEYQYAAQTSARDVNVQVTGFNSGQPLAGPESDRSYGNFSVGTTVVVPRGLSGYFDFQYLFGKDNFNDSRYTLGLRYQF